MATINDCKVKEEDFTDLDIMSLPSRPSAAGMSASQLQERFDAGSKQVIRPRLNQLIEILNSIEGAANIGVAPIDGVAGYFLQEMLVAFKLLLDDKKSIESADREIGLKFDTAEAQSLVKEVTFSEDSGIFTITKYDGSKQTIDTAIEKVALDVRLDGQQFVLTLVDGTEQRVDLSAFLTQTEVQSSDTITLAIENGAIVARLAAGSVKLSHLNAEVTSYIDAKELAAYQSAQAAAVSEQNALNSANAAKASEQAAKQYQEQACACATQAGLSRDAAASSESNAKASEQAAKTAQQAAENAAKQAEGIAGGDFLERPVYDPNNKKQDIFKYVDDAVKNLTADDIGAISENKIILDATSGAKTITLAENASGTEYRFVYASGIISLSLSTVESLDNTAEVYFNIVFVSGTSATTITDNIGCYFAGDDCADGVFYPSVTKTYEVGIWWNGISWQAVVRGV